MKIPAGAKVKAWLVNSNTSILNNFFENHVILKAKIIKNNNNRIVIFAYLDKERKND